MQHNTTQLSQSIKGNFSTSLVLASQITYSVYLLAVMLSIWTTFLSFSPLEMHWNVVSMVSFERWALSDDDDDDDDYDITYLFFLHWLVRLRSIVVVVVVSVVVAIVAATIAFIIISICSLERKWTERRRCHRMSQSIISIEK